VAVVRRDDETPASIEVYGMSERPTGETHLYSVRHSVRRYAEAILRQHRADVAPGWTPGL